MPRDHRRSGLVILSATALCAALVIPSASASREDGRFFVHAWNTDDPQFRATAGLNGLSESDGGSGGAPGGGSTTDPDEPGTVELISAPRDNWTAVARGDGQYLALAVQSGNTMHSTDGKFWERGEVSLPGTWRSMAYGNGKYVAVASSGEVMSSTDGVNWVEVDSGSNLLVSIAFGNGLFVAVGESDDISPIIYSKDGVNWTEAKAPATVTGKDVSDTILVAVSFVGDRFFATSTLTGVNSESSSNFNFESSDGISWNEVPLVPGATIDPSPMAYSLNTVLKTSDGYLIGANELHGWNPNAAKMFASTDGLKSWHEVPQTGLAPGAAFLGSTGNAIVALSPDGGGFKVVASKDGGKSWVDSGQRTPPYFLLPNSASADGCLVVPLIDNDTLIRYCE